MGEYFFPQQFEHKLVSFIWFIWLESSILYLVFLLFNRLNARSGRYAKTNLCKKC